MNRYASPDHTGPAAVAGLSKRIKVRNGDDSLQCMGTIRKPSLPEIEREYGGGGVEELRAALEEKDIALETALNDYAREAREHADDEVRADQAEGTLREIADGEFEDIIGEAGDLTVEDQLRATARHGLRLLIPHCPACGSGNPFVVKGACALDSHEPDPWHRHNLSRPAITAAEGGER